MASAPAAPPSDVALREGIWAEADSVDENCDYSSQRHFNAASLCDRQHYGLGGGAILLAVMAAGTILYPPWFSVWLSGVSAMGSAALTGASTLLKPKEFASAHARAGSAYLALRNQARSFKRLDLRDPQSNATELLSLVREMTSKMDRFNESFSTLFTPRWAYLKAKREIRRGQTRNRADGAHRRGPDPESAKEG